MGKLYHPGPYKSFVGPVRERRGGGTNKWPSSALYSVGL